MACVVGVAVVVVVVVRWCMVLQGELRCVSGVSGVGCWVYYALLPCARRQGSGFGYLCPLLTMFSHVLT